MYKVNDNSEINTNIQIESNSNMLILTDIFKVINDIDYNNQINTSDQITINDQTNTSDQTNTIEQSIINEQTNTSDQINNNDQTNTNEQTNTSDQINTNDQTTINNQEYQDIIPSENNTYSLGSMSKYWNNAVLYNARIINNLFLDSVGITCDVEGTSIYGNFLNFSQGSYLKFFDISGLASDMNPAITNTHSLGNESLRYKQIYSVNFDGNLSGIANKANLLTNDRKINGIIFNNSQDINISGNDLVGTKLSSNIIESNLEKVGELKGCSLQYGYYFSGSEEIVEIDSNSNNIILNPNIHSGKLIISSEKGQLNWFLTNSSKTCIYKIYRTNDQENGSINASLIINYNNKKVVLNNGDNVVFFTNPTSINLLSSNIKPYYSSITMLNNQFITNNIWTVMELNEIINNMGESSIDCIKNNRFIPRASGLYQISVNIEFTQAFNGYIMLQITDDKNYWTSKQFYNVSRTLNLSKTITKYFNGIDDYIYINICHFSGTIRILLKSINGILNSYLSFNRLNI
jgi:hypothetical protein